MAEENKEKDKQKKNIVAAKLVDVPAQFVKMIELSDGRVISDIELLVEIYNKVDRIAKSVA